ncbi:MAG: hypothetical protein KUG78_08450 [Kangiellaceae bacterium]|nr:hypothetical protein [Kangiellaceae bacterium]
MNDKTTSITYLEKHPEMVFREGKPTAHELMSGLITDAITSGVKSLLVKKLDSWWVVNGDIDWTKKNSREIDDWKEIFNSLIPNNIVGPTSSRTEVIVRVFCEGVFLYDSTSREKCEIGELPPQEVTEVVFQNDGFSIAFKV